MVHKCYTEFSSLNRYPIYIVPSRNNEKELEACFLTYHTLSSSFEGIAIFLFFESIIVVQIVVFSNIIVSDCV
ncbi:hypothetical protein VIGAN_03230800 [Vigna angularis var. angularis]|uniref:Uncharacterized protein n=1 Tax=Vigna angularis var. angularis TaxID=157739 RepID=A0A0S3RP16_PHAAN|nr:hypothetical protein VIGAN_03230800 [Vigna angularis var. angularis]